MSERALLLVNPKSRRGGALAEALPGLLAGHGLQVEVVAPESGEAVAGALRAQAPGAARVVVAGGDGTLNHAAPALRALGLPVGLVPLGTANDLARNLGIPADVQAAAAVAAGHRLRAVDLGTVNGRPYFNVASIGLGSHVTRALDARTKGLTGKLGYLVALTRATRRIHPFRVMLRVDGGPPRTFRAIHLAVGNGRFYGGGASVAADARIDDGRLDLYALEPRRLVGLLLRAPLVFLGRHRALGGVVAVRGTDIEVRTRRPRAVSADGELLEHTPAHFAVEPGALRFYVPAGNGGEGERP
jgi:YegS/Rv2252/BmrU family lipid kinase